MDLTIADPAAGVFGYERLTKLTDISDGPATPIMVLETMRENGPWIAGGRPTVRGLIRDDQPYLGVARQFGGAHRGITVVLFADGSIRAIRDSIDPRTLEALATIAASDSIGQYTTD